MSVNVPWVEKYRPRNIDEVVGNHETVSRLRIIAQDGNLPNVLLAGPPGTGKTTSIMCLARALLGAELAKEAVLELNASDERGLDVVRSKIKNFAMRKVKLPSPSHHKIVILDEADSMTGAAQQALRRTMENHSSTTRFAFACNNSSKIIEPIQSRCAVVRFTRISNDEIRRRVTFILDAEKVEYSDDGVEAALYIAEGDMRNALNCVQATAAGYGFVSAENVFKVCSQPHPIVIESILTLCVSPAERSLEKAHHELNRILQRGYTAGDVMPTFFKVAQNSSLFKDEDTQMRCLRIIGETNVRVAEGNGSPLQLAAMLSHLILLN